MMESRNELLKFKSLQITPTSLHVRYELRQLLEHLSKNGFLVECSSKEIPTVVRYALNQVFHKDEQLVKQIMKNWFLYQEWDILENKVTGTINTFWLLTSTSFEGVDSTSVVIRLNQAARGFKLLIIVINPKGNRVGDLIHHLWAHNLRHRCFLNRLLQLSSLNELESVYYNHQINNVEKCKTNRGSDKRPFSGIHENLNRRLKHYISDFIDGLRGDGTWSKVVSTTLFLYFLTILASTAMGVLNEKNTIGHIDSNRALIGQAIGGIVWALFSGQPFVIVATTAPLALCNKVVFDLSHQLDIDFYPLYAWIGIWNSLFCVCFGIFNASRLIKHSTRFVEEIFCFFSVICFAEAGLRDLIFNINTCYLNHHPPPPPHPPLTTPSPQIRHSELPFPEICGLDSSMLFIVLMMGTLCLGLILYRFHARYCGLSPLIMYLIQQRSFTRKYFSESFRQVISDFALPASVIVYSLLADLIFNHIPSKCHHLGYLLLTIPGLLVERFEVSGTFDLKIADLKNISIAGLLLSPIFGFAISMLFFMDQGISARMVNIPSNKIKKGNADDWDFFLIGVVNVFLSIFGLPWINGLLPHSPLHVKCLANYEDVVLSDGTVSRTIVDVRETRIAALVCHILIALSIFGAPQVISLIPVPVLDGLFLFCAFSLLENNNFWDRMCIFVTQKTKLPNVSFITKCPLKSTINFTIIQFVCFLMLTFIGFSPWPLLRMVFPIIIVILIPIRHKLLPRIFERRILKILDGYD